MSDLPEALSRRIETLRSLPTPPKLVIPLIELSQDPDSELDACVNLIQADSSLSSKLLGTTNSAGVGSRQWVRTIKHVVSLLGTSNVRALAMGHSLAGIYSRCELEEEDARAYWEASLCKALAAQMLARITVPSRADEVFAISLFQDVGVGFFVASAGTEFAELLRDPRFTVQAQLRYECARFGLDHAAAGRRLAHKLELPKIYIDATELHHDEYELTRAVNNDQMARALGIASLLPHDIRSWKPEDILYLSFALKDQFPGRWAHGSAASAFIHDVEPAFAALLTNLSLDSAKPTSLVEFMNQAYHDNVQFAIPLAPRA